MKNKLDQTNSPTEVIPPIKFTDLFELEKIQQLQDLFADTHGLASMITEPDGTPITNPSNFTRLCKDIIRKTELGCANCYKSDASIGYYNPEFPVIQKCLSTGLWDASACITVGDKHIANWLIGQVQNEDLDIQELIKYADEIGADEEAFMEALNEVPVMSSDQFQKIAKMLFVFANELSERALVNLQLKQESFEREKLITQLKESEERYRLIAENTADSIAVFDLNMNYTFLSPSVFNLLGYTPEELMEFRYKDITTPDSWEKVQQIFTEEMELERAGNADPKRSRVIDNEQIRKDGRKIWVESTVSFIRDQSGQPQNILAVSKDITDRVLKEKALEESEEKYRTIFENVHDVFYRIGLDSTILEISPSIKYFSEFDRNEILGADVKEIYYDQDERNIFLQALYEKIELTDYEISLKTKSGSRKYASINARLVFDDQGKPIHITGSIRDITKRKLAEIELQETNKRLLNIFNHMPILLNAFDESNEITFWNKACEESTGYAANEIIGNPLAMELLYPDSKYREIVWNSSMDSSNHKNTYDLVTKSGEIRTIEWFDIHHQIAIAGWSSWGFGLDITERQKAVNELIKAKEDAEDSEQRLFAFIDSIPDVVCYKDGKGRWLLANDADLELFCLKGIDYYGKTDIELAEFTDKLYKDAFRSCVTSDETAWMKGIISHGIEFIPTINGELKVLEVIKVPQFYHDGSRKGLAVIGRDITKLHETQEKIKDANAELKEKESRLKLALASGKLGIWEWNLEDNTVTWDARMFELYGIAEKDFTHNCDSWVNSLHPEDKRRAMDEWAAALEENKDFNLSFRVILPNGKIRYIKANGLVIRDNDGKPLRMIGINRNITKTRLYEQELIQAKENAESDRKNLIELNEEIKLNNERLESLLRISQLQVSSVQHLLDFALEEAIKLTGSKIGYIYFYNESTRQFILNTWSKDVMNECRVMQPQTTYDLEKTGCWGEVIRQRKPIVINNYLAENEFKRGTPNGHVQLRKFLSIPVFSEKKIVAVAGIGNKETDYDQFDIRQLTLLMDSVWKIKERIGLFENLRIAKEKAEESDLLKSAFLANMSHEIRTPLNSIIGFSGLLNDPFYNDDEKSEFTKTIIEQSNNLMIVINDIMDLSMIDAKQLKIRNEKFSTNELICDLKNDFSLTAERKGLVIAINIPDTTNDPIIEIDKYRLKQIFNNLISNALKFTNEGFIEIGYSLNNNLIEFYVKDTGIGISEKNYQVIFERFRQVDNTKTRKYGGNGLGLAITKNLLEMLGGKIWVKSEEKKGSTFYFSLPLK